MENYCGQTANDQIQGGGSYVKKHGIGHEVCNFAPNPDDGYLYGYVQPIAETIDLKRLDQNSNGVSISGVTVIWVATHHVKKGSLGAKIVGWYRNATVFTTFQPFEHIPVLQKENGISRYIIKAPSDQAVLLPVDARVITIPRAQDIKGFFGQSNVWYGDAKNEDVQKFVHKITNYIEQYEKESILEDLKNKQSYAKDQERKVKVEQAAIRTSICYFEQLGYAVRSVEKDNCGWDLEAEAGRTSLRIEVKGLSGDVFNIGLTPNEYKAFEKKSDDYRLSVVTNALKEPKLFICRFSEEQNGWIAETEGESPKKLNIELISSASISC
jgi:hypothetical protein